MRKTKQLEPRINVVAMILRVNGADFYALIHNPVVKILMKRCGVLGWKILQR